MLRWKQDYHLQKNRLIKDESGITLVELLAAISILSIVILLGGAIHIFGQRQFNNQTEAASQANDLSYALTVMTTEIRKESQESVTVEENQAIHIGEEHRFYINDKKLYHNGNVLAEPINSIEVEKGENEIHIILHGSTQHAQKKKYETTIYFRR